MAAVGAWASRILPPVERGPRNSIVAARPAGPVGPRRFSFPVSLPRCGSSAGPTTASGPALNAVCARPRARCRWWSSASSSRRETMARMLADSPYLDAAPDLTRPRTCGQFHEQARRAMEGLGGWVVLSTPKADPQHAAPVRRPRCRGGRRKSTAFRSSPTTDADAGSEGSRQRRARRRRSRRRSQRGGAHAVERRPTVSPADLQRIVENQRMPADWITAVIDSERPDRGPPPRCRALGRPDVDATT